VHDPGKIIADLAVAVAVDGDFLADIAMLRSQPELTGPVASDLVVSRLVTALAEDTPQGAQDDSRGAGRVWERAWQLAGDATPGTGGGLVTVDLDATLVTAFSEAVRGPHAARPPGRP
jgi:hypothetical protein